MRLRSDFWVAAYLRRCGTQNIDAVLRRRGAAEAGAVFVALDRLDGSCALFGPAPQSEATDGEDRRFLRLHKEPWIDALDLEARLSRQISFDSDLWVIAVDDPQGRHGLNCVD